jgi:hypothetical protein
VRTLRCWIASANFLGPKGVLGQANEKRLLKHIHRFVAAGLAPNKQTVRELAYQLAPRLVSITNFGTIKKCRFRLGLLHSVKETRKFPLDRRSYYRCWKHKEWTEKKLIFFKCWKQLQRERSS